VKIETIAIEKLTPDPRNARRHDRRNVEAIAASLTRFGQQKPIVVDAKNVVRAGNGTLAAAMTLGWKYLDVVRTKLAGDEASAYGITDNRSAELAEWDKDVLIDFLSDDAIGEVGFLDVEIRALLGDFDPGTDQTADEKKPQRVTCPGCGKRFVPADPKTQKAAKRKGR
jgi:ParB-like chromosome segregation protein Spo0J